jgi:exopolysaccharide biosynthesis polyprenyl glycosylphosphotransferase
VLKEQAKLLKRVSKFLDLALVVVSFYLAFRFARMLGKEGDWTASAWVLFFIIPIWHFFLDRYRLYESIRTTPLSRVVASVAKAHLLGGVTTAAIVFSVDQEAMSRLFLALLVLCSFILLTAGKGSVKFLLGHFRRRGFNTRNILLVGTPENIRKFVPVLEKHLDWGLRVIGVVAPRDDPWSGDSDYAVLGTIDEIGEVCKQHTVDEAVFCFSRERIGMMDRCIDEIELLGVTVRVVLDIHFSRNSRREISFFHDGTPIVTFYGKAFDSSQLMLKRGLDICGALIGLVASALLFPFIAAAIRLDSPGPFFFGQRRVGENGRTFTCWKFRSMYVNAEERKKELLHLNEMSGAVFKLKNDPRITRVGRFLRKTSLDELPQFWNVLKGEMALVGTRPPTPDEVAMYQNWQRKRICIRPGITGLWQVSGRNRISDFDGIVRLDLEYIESWNLWLDLKILAKTFFVVLSRDGSC